MTKATPSTVAALTVPAPRNIGRGGARDARLLKIARRDLASAKAREAKYKARIEERLEGAEVGYVELEGVQVNVVRITNGSQPHVDWDLLLQRYPRIYKMVRKVTKYRSIKVL